MFVAKVTGSVVATQKVDSMVGYKLLVVEPYRIDAADRTRLLSTGRTFVAVDTVGAGQDEFVLIVQGSSARLTPETKTCRSTPPLSASSTRCTSTVRAFTTARSRTDFHSSRLFPFTNPQLF